MFWQSFECEICKTIYPCIRPYAKCSLSGTQGKEVQLRGYDEGSYWGPFETINKGKSVARTIHVITPSPGNTLFKIGRGHESDIRVADISVSRVHVRVYIYRILGSALLHQGGLPGRRQPLQVRYPDSGSKHH
jgi:hypothetical protein